VLTDFSIRSCFNVFFNETGVRVVAFCSDVEVGGVLTDVDDSVFKLRADVDAGGVLPRESNVEVWTVELFAVPAFEVDAVECKLSPEAV
jgi:hypothetical protein